MNLDQVCELSKPQDIKFEFDVEFQILLLSHLCQNYQFLKLVVSKIKPEHFTTRGLSWIFSTIQGHYNAYQTAIDEMALDVYYNKLKGTKQFEILKYSEIQDVMPRLFKPVAQQKFIEAEVIRFIKHQEVLLAFYSAIPLVKIGDHDKLLSVFQKAVSFGSSLGNKGSNYFSDFADRLARELRRGEEESIPTGIPGVDMNLEYGGIQYQDFGLVMAPPNTGKTFMFGQMAKRCVVEFKRCVYIYNEGPEHKLERRFDRLWTQIPKDEYLDKIHLVHKKLTQYQQKYKDLLFVKSYPANKCTIEDLGGYLEDLNAEGFKVDLLLVDYLEGMKCPYAGDDKEYQRIGALCKGLKSLAQEFNLGCWAATHVKSEAFGKSRLSMRDLGKAIVDKAAIADIILALCQTPEEEKQQVMRIVLAKNREERKSKEIQIVTDYDRAIFCKMA